MKQKHNTLVFYLILFSFTLIPGFFCPSKAYAAASAEDAWFLDDINAQNAWAVLSQSRPETTSPVIVAVIDTGCDYSHPLIQNALWTNPAESGGMPGADDDGNGYIDDIHGIDAYNHDSDPMDDSTGTIQGQGTHVAGCILQAAGVTETSNPFGIQIMPIKAGDNYGNFHAADVAEALRYAADNGAAVINMSINALESPSSLQEALEYASQSAILVASAGNNGLPTSDSLYAACGSCYPAAYSYVAGIMSYGKNHQLSDFSNWDFSSGTDPEYEIAAPGEDILSCTYNGAEKNMSGTSMSAGIISGCAALLAAKYNSLGIYSPKDLTAHLMSSGPDDISFTDLHGKTYSFRRIDLYRLLSDSPRPNLVLTSYSILKDESAPGSYHLNYSVSNKGCAAKNIKASISADSPDVDLQAGAELSETIPALSSVNSNLNVSMPENSQAKPIEFTVRLSYENGADPSSQEIYFYEKKISTSMEHIPFDKEIPLQDITISAQPQTSMKAGSSLQLAVSYIPENTTDDRSLSFQSSNPLVAEADENGMILAKKSGVAEITVTSSKQHVRQITVTVYEETDPAPNPDPTPADPTTPPGQEDKKPSASIQKGTVYTIDGMKYKVTNTGKSKTVTLIGTAKKPSSVRSLTVKSSIRIKNAKFQVAAIGKSAFSNCKNLKTVKIPDSVQSIGTACFSKCVSLSALSIGKGIAKISSLAFDGCKKLKKITIKSKKHVSIGKHAFRGIHPKAKLPPL